MKKNISIVYMVLFLAIIFFFSVATLFTKDREVSKLENRKLEQIPTFSTKALLSGEYFKNINAYASDQIILRDNLVMAYQKQQSSSIFDSMFLQNTFHVFASNNIQHGQNIDHSGTVPEEVKVFDNRIVMINKKWQLPMLSDHFQKDALNGSIDAVNKEAKIAKELGTEAIFVQTPNKGITLSHLYPNYLRFTQSFEAKDYFLSHLSHDMKVIDLQSDFDKYTNAEKETMYLETDHHWNIKGAFLGYQHTINHLNKVSSKFKGTPLTMKDIKVSMLDKGRFEGSYNSQLNFLIDPNKADRTFIYKPTKPFSFSKFEMITSKDSVVKEFNKYYGAGIGESTLTYGKLYAGDQKKVFYQNKKAPNKLKVLMVKDSYANPITPYFAQNFYELTIVDNRYYDEFSLKKLLKEQHYDMMIMFFHNLNLNSGNYEFEKQKQ